MAVDMAPGTWIAGLSEDGTNVSFPIASVPELTAAEADGTTGSFSNWIYAVLCKVYAVYASLTTKPTGMKVYKSSSTDETTGKITVSFNLQFVTSVSTGSQNVDAES